MKKYKLTDNKKIGLFQIQALIDIPAIGVKKGDLGGWVEDEHNLSQDGNCWVSGNAHVSDKAHVSGDAHVFGNARVYGNAYVTGNAHVSDKAHVSGDAHVFGNARVYGNAYVFGNAWVEKGWYVTALLTISGTLFSINPQYPNHIRVGCKIFEICSPQKAKKLLDGHGVPEKYYKQLLLAMKLCKQWLDDNPEPKEDL